MEPVRKIAPAPWMKNPETRRILEVLQAGGSPARFVGGCVRDTLLGRAVKDVDIATAEPPDRVIELIEQAGLRAIPTGLAHGTVTALVGDAHFEITTLRHDVETDGRRARVAFTDDWTADAERRDFTFNAIFCDADGTLYDPTGGLADLEAGRVRFVGVPVERLREDVLRLLRFFRLYAYYGSVSPDVEALEACRTMAPNIAALSIERVWGELRRILTAPDPVTVLDLMERWSVLEHVLPEAGSRDRLARLTAIETTLDETPAAIRRLAALVDTDASGAGALARRLKLSKAAAGRLEVLTVPPGRPSPAAGDTPNRELLYRVGPERFVDLVLLGWASDAHSNDADWRGLVSLPGRAPVPPFPLGGKDVLALGVAPGTRVGALLEAVETWWIERGFAPDRDACLERLRQLA